MDVSTDDSCDDESYFPSANVSSDESEHASTSDDSEHDSTFRTSPIKQKELECLSNAQVKPTQCIKKGMLQNKKASFLPFISFLSSFKFVLV